jgi:lipopolysaccharide biosynthesis protein
VTTRALAFYLPQYHPVPENERWWGPGFTDWRNVARARPLFRGHEQPHVPADLGFYDLRVPETRESQAALAAAHGIAGFCYYHYWFQGRQVLEQPVREVLRSGRPDFPFALCWANEPWTRAWDGRSGEVLLGQEYSASDDVEHLRHLLPAFTDPRYVRVAGKPLFLVYKAGALPDPRATADRWRAEAARAGLPGLYLCRVEHDDDRGDAAAIGFDASVDFQPDFAHLGVALRRDPLRRAARRLGIGAQVYRRHRVYDYDTMVERMRARPPVDYKRFPGVTPGWDNTPRRQRQGILVRGSTPRAYGDWLRATVDSFTPFGPDEDLVFVNAWNEWAEGNHLEPSRRWGRAYLEATRDVLAPALVAEA